MAVENAPTPLYDAGSDGDGNTLRVRRRAKRRTRRVGPYGAILLISTLMQRSMAAGGFFEVRRTNMFFFKYLVR